MKKDRRWMKSVIAASNEVQVTLPWTIPIRALGSGRNSGRSYGNFDSAAAVSHLSRTDVPLCERAVAGSV